MARDDENAGIIVDGQVRCEACPLIKCDGLRQPPIELRKWIASFRQGEAHYIRGEQVFDQGARPKHLYTVLSGVLMRTRLLEDGRRQVINFMFPGDFIGLQAALDGEMSHAVEAVTAVTLCAFSRDRFFDMVASQPRLAFDMTWLAAHEEAALEEHIVSLGQRNARERMTALAVFLLQRALDTGLAPGGILAMTVTQAQIADMLGLSLVHTNRTMQTLRRLQIVDWTVNSIRIPDMANARQFAGIDAGTFGLPRPYI